MGLLENPGRKLKSVTQVAFIIGVVFIILVAVFCLVVLSQSYYYDSAGLKFIIIFVAFLLLLALWIETLFISAYADMAAQLKRQTEILERIESRLSGGRPEQEPPSSFI